MKIQEELFKLQDISYKEFHSKLIPTVDKNTIIGIRIPLLRSYAMKIKYTKEADKFLNTLPHTYYDENVLHALLLSEMTDYETFIKSIQAFLPYIDNWAVCDVLKPKSIKKHNEWKKYVVIIPFLGNFCIFAQKIKHFTNESTFQRRSIGRIV